MANEKISPQKLGKMPIEAVAGMLLDRYGIEMDPEKVDHAEIKKTFMDEQANEFEETKDNPAPTAKQAQAMKKRLEDLGPGEYHPDLDERVRCVIAQEKGESLYVDIGVNGFPFRVKRGEEVNLPRAAYNVLMDAKVGYLERDENQNLVHRERPRFNVQRLD